MKQVSKEQFYAVINPLNVHPYARDPEYSEWETPDRKLIGVSYPGWKYPEREEKYFLNIIGEKQ